MPSTSGFVGLIDAFEIFDRALSHDEIQTIFIAGSAGKGKEPDNDGDGVPNDEDERPDSDLRAPVVIESCNSGVSNPVFPSGCTSADFMTACAERASTHGQFVTCVSHLGNLLKNFSIITAQQKTALHSCAAQANIP